MAIKAITDAAELIAEVRLVFSKIENLAEAQKAITEVLEKQDQRIRELEAGLREMRAEVKFEALKETQGIVNSVQGRFYEELHRISLQLDRISRTSGIDHSDHSTTMDGPSEPGLLDIGPEVADGS